MARVSDRLKDRLNGIRAYPVGLSADDVRQLQLTADLMDDILSSLASDDLVDQQIALFFAEVLVWPQQIGALREKTFVSRIVELCRRPTNPVQSSALHLVSRYHAEVPDFRPLMMNGLLSTDPMVRKEALLAYELYCHPKEVVPLEGFERDDYLTETAMGGPLIYELRNLALETIEHVIRKQFRKTEKTEAQPTGEVAFWWDWAPYHSWKNGFLGRLFKR
jgi:hypothetical protein